MRFTSNLLVAMLASVSVTVSAVPFSLESELASALSVVEQAIPTPSAPTPAPGTCSPPTPPPGTPTPSKTQPGQDGEYLDFEQKFASSGSCNVQSAVQHMHLDAVTPALPAPAGLTLFQVAIGRGTQNYTCDLANATATPVSIGALATLFDFSCVAAEKPSLLHRLPHIALNRPVPSTENTNADVVNNSIIGHHYFINYTIPFFNLNTAQHQYGLGALAKANVSDAPSGADPGPQGKGNGAVSWVRLVQTPYAEEDWTAVYRLNTAGGNPPLTCTGQKAEFDVPYSAEYWIFK